MDIKNAISLGGFLHDKETTLEYISDEIILQLQHIVPNIQLDDIEVRCLSNGGQYIHLKTKQFNTFPIMFRKVWIVAETDYLNKESNTLGFSIRYEYETFRGGKNATEIGTMIFKVINNEIKLYKNLQFN